MNEMERKTKHVKIRRKHTSTDFQIANSMLLVSITLDPGTEDAALLGLTNLRQDEVRRLRDLCDLLLMEVWGGVR
jgi:hypothetical protein